MTTRNRLATCRYWAGCINGEAKLKARKIKRLLLSLVALQGCAPAVVGQTNKPELRRVEPTTLQAKPRTPAQARRETLAGVQSWAYQLRLIRFSEIAASPFDLVVVDHALAANRRFARQFSPEIIQAAKTKTDGSRRIVLAYLSIGEAERYRFYWDQAWNEPATKPAWLGDVNPVWDGNYLVRFWYPAWQSIILDGPESYLARIQAAGFDGVYLDRADVYSELTKDHSNAEAEMERFIVKIATAARAANPEFLIVMQNAEELLERKPVRDAIDGIAKEDLFYGIDHKASPNDTANIDWSLKLLRLARNAGRRVLVVEYLSESEKARDARRRAEAEGFLIHFTVRDLGDLTLIAPDRNPAAPSLSQPPSGTATPPPPSPPGVPAR